MKRKEKQQKLHNSLINMLYPPPSPSPSPSPSPPHQNEFDQQTLDLALEIVNSDHHQINTDVLDEEKGVSVSSEEEDDDELGIQKLTRAQRKRLRRKKLKEAASNRRLIIGPELPDNAIADIDCDRNKFHETQQSEGVRRNASEGSEKVSCAKVKHRRMSKKNAIDKPKSPHETTNNHGDQS
ncbi:uncharacterized protein [Rutidosis leptorrhynchoides]|uniref:uncharacterized protein n=1 Tax=Rutidosis leptorrhynchoides TaxID=125765 RepID=UPI003A999D06